MSSTTLINPLSTVFTPPADCATSWTYEGTYYNSDPNGVMMQNLNAAQIDATCFPESFQQYGRAGTVAQIYSPGWCPIGYSTAQQGVQRATTTAVCCPSGYEYYTAFAGINYNGQSEEFQGCTSTYPGGQTTSVPDRAGDTDLSSTVVTGPILMWAQAITIGFREQDVALFTTTSSSVTSSSASPSGTMTNPSPTAPATDTSTPAPDPSGLSSGAIAAIVVGAVAGVAILVVLAWFLLRRRSKARAQGVHEQGVSYEPQMSAPSEPQMSTPMQSNCSIDQNQPWLGTYKSSKPKESTSIAEREAARRRSELEDTSRQDF